MTRTNALLSTWNTPGIWRAPPDHPPPCAPPALRVVLRPWLGWRSLTHDAVVAIVDDDVVPLEGRPIRVNAIDDRDIIEPLSYPPIVLPSS